MLLFFINLFYLFEKKKEKKKPIYNRNFLNLQKINYT
jgi:hypothetical protein